MVIFDRDVPAYTVEISNRYNHQSSFVLGFTGLEFRFVKSGGVNGNNTHMLKVKEFVKNYSHSFKNLFSLFHPRMIFSMPPLPLLSN